MAAAARSLCITKATGGELLYLSQFAEAFSA